MPTNPHITAALDGAFNPQAAEGNKPNTNISSALDSVLGPSAARPAATSSLIKASGVNPDEEVTRRDLAQQLGKPAALLPPTPQAQAALRDKQNAEAITQAPKLATWLEKPENAAVAVDDVPHLAKIESTLGGIKRAPATFANMWKGLKTTFTETFIGTAAGAHAMAYSYDIEKARDESGLTKAEAYLPAGHPEIVAAGKRFAEMSKGAQQKLDIATGVYRDTLSRIDEDRPEFETKLGEMTFDAVTGVAVSAPVVASYFLPGVGLAAGSLTTFAQTQASAFGKYAERGATFKEAMAGSGLEGLAEAGFAALPMGYVVGKLGGKTGLGQFFAGTLVREVPSEVATYIAQSAVDTAIANPNKTWEQWRSELPEGIAQTMYQATIGSMLMASPHAGVRLLGKKHEDAREAEATQETLQNMDTLARESALRTRSAADFQSFLETLTDETEVQDAFIDAKTLAATLQTPQGQALASALPDLAQRVQEALATNSDVRMPIAQYAAHVSGSELSAELMPATKLSADGMTYAQAQTHYSTLAEQMKEQAAEIDSMRVLTREEFDAKQQAEIAAEEQAAQQPAKTVGDRRSYTPEGARVDRRQDPERRKTIDETLAAMATPEERESYLRKELFTDKMTGLGNRRAYEEVPKKALQVSIDADSLKWVNDNMSPDSGDAMLTAIGQALKELDLDAYHISGDEFFVQGDNESDLRAAMDLAQEALKNATIVVERPDGTIVEKKGVDITYGIGKDKAEADYKLKKEKVSREEAGLRAGRGQEPKGISRRAAEGQQDQVGDVAKPKARQTYEEYLAQHPNKDALFEADAKKVEATLIADLEKTGRYSATVTATNAAPVIDFYKNTAKQLGLKPSEAYARYPLKVTSEDTSGYAQQQTGDLQGLPAVVVVDGKEMEFHAYQPARDAAAAYMAKAGIPYMPVTQYVKVDKERAARIAAEFDKMEHKPNDPEVKAAYDALAKETLAQWEFVKATGLKVEFIEGADPYGNPRHAIRDIVDNNHMWVYPTEAGFGGKEVSNVDIEGNPLLAVVPGETISGKPVRINDIFRIVHDYFGHVKEGVGFRADGEENAWRIHSSMFSNLARKALTTETRGQNSWLNFGPYGDKNRTAKPEDTQFAPQKTGLLPDWVVNEGVRDGLQIRGVHFAKTKLDTLDGRKYGTGIKGAEAKRLAETDDVRLKQRTAFYVDEGNGVFPEGGLGRERHEATLTGLYDAKVNPLKLPAKDPNAFESAVLDAGFKGYYVRAGFGRQGVIVVLGEHSHAIKVDHVTSTYKQSDVSKSGLGFYSGLLKALSSAKQESAPASDWVNILKALPGVKAEELADTGVLSWLDGKGKEKTSKDAVADFVATHGIQLEEITTGILTQRERDKIEEYVTERKQEYVDRILQDWEAPYYVVEEEREIEDPETGETDSETAYVIRAPNGYATDETYDTEEEAQEQADAWNNQEAHFARGRVEDDISGMREDEWEAEIKADLGVPETQYESYTLKGGSNYREVLLTIPEASYESSHFETVPGIVVHFRLKDRMTPDRKRVLFVEEIQSDWAQDFRKTGGGKATVRPRQVGARTVYQIVLPNGDVYREETNEHSANLVAENWTRTVGDATPRGPFVTDTKAWTTLALKRIMIHAADGGYDAIAWTTGEQQQKRYRLSEKVDTLEYLAAENRLIGWKDGTEKFRKDGVTKEDLPDYVGKDVTKKLLESAADEDDTYVLSGEGLDVGNRGMIGFYDGIVPQVAKDLLKKTKLGKLATVTVDGMDQPGIEFAPDALKRLADEGLPLYQGDRGSFNPSTLTIGLLRGADLSTFIHESGHFFLEAMADIASRADAPPAVQQDFDKVLSWFGVKDRETWNAMTLEQKRQYHEQWAESYERWNLEGKAPSAELVPVFARFRAWMLQVYKSVEEFIRRNPASGKLNDDIRGVFSRMLAAESAIADAEQMHGYAKVLEALSAADPKSADELKASSEAATFSAVSYVEKRGVADMKWMSGAKNKILKELQAEANTKRKVIREEVTQEVMREPVHALRAALKGKDSTLKLHTGVLHELMPDLDVSTLRGMTSTENGTHPDQVADAYGYKSTGEMVEALVNAEPTKEKIDGLTDQRMLERHGELVDDRALEHAANLAIHNEARARFMATGLKALSKSQIPANQLAKAAKEAANALIARKKIRDIKPAVYEAAELKANRDVLKTVATNPAAAADAQKSALLNNRLVRSATDALDEVDKGVARMRRLEKKAAQDNMRGEFLVQLNALLDRFDLRTSVSLKAIDEAKVPFKDWMEAHAEEISAVLPDVPEWVFNEGYKKHYKDLTVEEFRGLMDTVKGLELLARREEKQYQAIRDMDFKAERKAVLDRIREYNPEAFTAEGEPKGMAPKFVKKFGDNAAKLGDKFVGEFLNAETIVNMLEGGTFGQLHESLLGRISKRIDWKADKLGELYKEMKHLFKAYSLNEKRNFSTKEIGKIGNDPITRENAVIIALLHGNAEGRERLSNYGWSVAEQQKAIGLLDDKDKNLVEGIWNIFDNNLWPELKELNERTRGKAPPKVAAVPFTVGGKQWTGGYFRLKYDTDLDERVQRMAEGDDIKSMMGGTLGMGAKTAQGSSTERKQGVQLRPRLDLGVFSEAVSETVHDIALREAVADTMRLLNDKGIQNAIKNTSGTASYRAIVQRVRDVAARPRDPMGFIEKAANLARKNTVVALMSGLGTAMQNVTGLVPAMHRVNTGRLLKEVSQFWNKKRYQFALDNSAYMRGRAESFDRNLQEESNKLRKAGKLLPEVSTMLWFMSQTDKLVSVPIWNTAYADGMAKFENDHEKAVDYADHTVRQTQGAGRDLDVSAIMTGHPLKRIFTMFYSYFNAQLGQLVRSGAINARLAKQNPALAVALFTKDFLLIVAIPAALTALVFSPPSDEDEDKDFADKLFAATVKYGLGMIPLVRDVGYFGLQKYWPEIFTPYGNAMKLSPVQSAAEGVVKLPGAVYDIATGEGTTQDQKDAIMGVSYAVGLPGKLISNTWTGTQAVLEGESPTALIYGAPYKPE